ncbi:putative Tudor/PWWP/MBT superfamily protein [Tripterygium wilfordii]|uniref:Putative Tudor/PWWP/MBT superfamily protein n=1 Tax=Tripterygium wilfordii TaxID=458696 RepID=A0A7J7D0K4_TRIWF|nr:uncharacterized protein LOC120010859 [Tripterygium wilfordii]KAF5739864.1 putative Tudor/PWWP/MBT superfamily protein [Tripterygium wilfordii]
MLSVMDNDCDFERKKSDAVEEASRVPGDGVDSANEVTVSSLGLESRARESEGDRMVLSNERSEDAKVRARVSEDIDGGVDKEMRVRVFEPKDGVRFDPLVDEFDGGDDASDSETGVSGSVDSMGDMYKSFLSEFDDYVASEENGSTLGTSRALKYGFEVGDMVWGKVKSHPWWPGHIFNEAFASPSVRRMRRNGHVLVAFFGDSSYGWFDPSELIPFDHNFADKSQQTTARNFINAVEEAMDEASRRPGLGLACRCRNPYNFRPTNVQGYFAVDVPDYERNVIYSVNQISKARDGFQPSAILSFVKQLALAPVESELMNLEFVNNKATVSFLRKAVFEEFDETYAQAFGVQPTHPSHENVVLPDREPTRAPLSGPLVIAEALSGGKSSKKPLKVKDHSKKDGGYLFKKRYEPSDATAIQVSPGQTSSLASAAYMGGPLALEAGDYVLQKRAASAHYLLAKDKQSDLLSGRDGAGLRGDLSGKDVQNINLASSHSSALARQVTDDVKPPYLNKEKVLYREMSEISTGFTDFSGKGVLPGLFDGTSPSFQQGETMPDLNYEQDVKISQSNEGFQPSGLSFSATPEGNYGLVQIQDDHTGENPSTDAKHSGKVNDNVKMKKPKVLKRPLGELSTDNSTTGEKKKKKKKVSGSKTVPHRPLKHITSGTGAGGNLARKSSHVSMVHKEDSWVNVQRKVGGAGNSMVNSVDASTMAGIGINQLKLPQLLKDLRGLALDPFHGSERNSSRTIQQFFLQFRALYYQKSLVLSPPIDYEPLEVSATKSSSGVGVSDISSGILTRKLLPSKPVKPNNRPEDPTKSGRKRLPSDRQEDIAAKRLKKINHLKSLTAEKKTAQKPVEGHRLEGKQQAIITPTRPIKANTVIRKMVPPARAVEPTMLVMKFPPETSLPSPAELKARFGRFGSIDQDAMRVFWRSFTCRVVFRHKLDALAAYKYAVGNKSLFGNVSVRYQLREVGGSAPEVSGSDKGRGDDTPVDTSQYKDPMSERPTPALAQLPLPQPNIQLKSCLKRSNGDETSQGTGGNGNGGRATARVKFMLGGEETSMVANRNNFNNNNTSFADAGASGSMDFNSKNNVHKAIPSSASSSSSSMLPFPPQFSKAPLNNFHHTEVVAPINSHNLNTCPVAPAVAGIDISQQMLCLMTRCSDVVDSLTGLLGFVPYHPL